MSDNYYCNPLQCIWKTIQQEKNEQRQLDTICGDLFPLFMEKCPSASSSLFQNTFGDGTALLSIISCKFVRQANEAISEGFDGVSTLLAASNYTKMLTMISALFDVNFHSSISEGLEPMLRIAAIHGIPSVLIALHDTILRIISNDPLSEYVVSPEVVCATQKHLSILQLFIYHADRKILAAFHNSNGFMSIVRTITVCFTFPFTASSSLTALAQELLTTILKRSVVSDIVCPHSIKEAAGDAIMRVLGGEGGLDTDLLSEASQAQKLSSFLHAIETWHTIISTLGSSPRISFLPLIESMLSLQSVMTAQMRTTQSLFDAFLQCAYRMEISSVASVYIPKKKKGLLSSAFSVARDILHTPHSIKTTKDVHRNAITQPECLEAAALFVIKSSSIEPRMWLASRLLRCVASEGPEPDLVSSILDTCSYKITSFESPLISELYLTIEAVCSTADISRSLSNIAAAVPFLEPSIIYKTFTFFIELAHKGPRMLGVVESCGIVEASCLVIENIANAGEVDAGNAQVVYCLWKVLLQSSSSLRYFTDAEAIMHALRCAVIEPTSPSAEMLHRASRSAIVNLVSYSKESVGVIVKGLLLKPNQKADWRLVSTYLSIFIVVLFGASCIEVAVSWSAIEICLSLLQSVRSSPSYSIDIYLIGSALSLLLPHARFNDSEKYTEMLEAAIPAIIVGSPEVVNLLILVACGESFNSENMGLLQDIFDKVVPIEKILTFPYEALKRGSYTTLVEHASPIILLCKWYDAESCPDKEKVRNVIHYLTKAYKSPINNVEFAKVVVKNEWIELFSQIGDFSPVLAAFIMPRISYNDEVDRKNKISTVLNLWKNAIVSDNHDSVNTITFCESGGAKGTLYLGNSVWPPSDGLSVSGWVYWQADSTIRLKGEVSWNRVMSKNCDYTNFDGRADIWSLSWNCESSDCFHSIRMFVDKEPRVTILSIDSPTCTTNVSLPYISPDEWTHFGMSIQRANSELSFYIDGCMVHNQTVHYPVTASVIQGGFLVTDKININLGFAPHTESYGTTVSIGEFQLFDDVIDSDVVQSVLASRHHTSGSSVGSSVFSLSAPILSQSIVKRLSCMNILTIQKGFLNMKTPDANLIASFHPYAAKTLSDIHINNKYWWLCNMAPFTGDLKLYGRHTTPPSTISSVALYLITQFGPHFWQQWLQDPVVCHDDYLLGVVLEIFAALSYKGSDFAAFASREIYFQFAAVVSINSKLFTSQPNVLEALVKCIISQCPTNTYVPKRVRDNRVKDKKCMLLINGPLAETLLMNWSFLTNITQHAATSLLLSIEELLCVNNTFKKVNAIRLKSFGFVETFVWGLAKVYVAPPLMEHARRIIECFVQCLHSDSEVVLELANVIVATVPNPIEGFGPLLEKIGSFLGPYCTFQIETLRNILLHAIAHAVSFGNFHQIIYPTWFIVLTGRDVHPLTVALTLRVFALLYTQFSVFRIRMEKAGVIKCLMQTLEQHSHQHDVISIVAHMTIGQVPDLMIASCVISDNPTVLIPQTAINPLLLHLIKYLAFSVQENFTTSVRATSMRVCDAFADIRLTRRPARLKYISQLVRSIIRIKKITSVKCSPVTPASISKSSSCTFSATYQTSTATKSFGEVSSEITLSETERRVDLLLCMLNFLRLTSSKYEYIASSLFSYSAGTSLLDSVGWVVLSAMNHSDEHREDSSRPSMPKNSSRDGYSDSSDYDLADIDATLGSCDVFELSLPRFPALLEAALGLFCTLQELHITSYESIYIGAVGIKTSSMVLLLHHILASCPIGVGSEAQSWFSIHVINIWMVNSLKIMRRTSLIGENGTNVTKNMIQNAIYVKDRLISGLPAPPRATANFIASIIDIVSNSDSIKALKEMIRDWAMYILSTEFHSWNSIKVADSIDMFYEYRSLLLAFPFSSSDTTKVFTARLLEISLIHIQSLNNLSDPITRKLAEIWEMMLNVNRSSTVFSSMLIDGGGSTGRNRIDLLHGGFDQLYYTGQVSGNTTESFIKWLVTNRPQISEVLNKNPNINIDVKHILSNPKKHLKWFTRSQEDIMNEEVSQDSKTSDILSSFNQGWEKVVFAGSSIDPSLLEIGKGIQCSHKLTVVRETTENNSVFEEGQSSTVAMYHHRSCIDTHRLYASLKAAQSPVTEMGGTPIGSVISHMYLGLEEPDRSSEVGVYHPSFLSSGSNINPKISSSGKALMKKIILGDVTEARVIRL